MFDILLLNMPLDCFTENQIANFNRATSHYCRNRSDMRPPLAHRYKTPQAGRVSATDWFNFPLKVASISQIWWPPEGVISCTTHLFHQLTYGSHFKGEVPICRNAWNECGWFICRPNSLRNGHVFVTIWLYFPIKTCHPQLNSYLLVNFS